MFEVATEWIQRVNQSRRATVDTNGKITASIQAIEPDVVFTKNTIGIYVTSASSPPNWYSAGDLLQAYLVGFGTAGYAQGEYIKVVLNRYHIHRFTKFPSIQGDSKYLISFVPKTYLKDVTIKVWEYAGENQGTTLEDLETQVKAVYQKVSSESSSIKALLKKLSK
jgi:hypothetical protein